MRRARPIALAVALGGLCIPCRAASGADAFWSEAVGARSLGLGGAGSALVGDLSSMVSNPAGLAALDRPSVMAHYTPSPLQTTSLFLSYGMPLGPVTAAAGVFQRSSGQIELTDPAGLSLGHKSFVDQAALLSLGTDALLIPLGVTVKRVQSRFNPYDVAGTGVDLGAQAAVGLWRAGLAWEDVGGTSLAGGAYAGGKTGEMVPSRLRAGLAWSQYSPEQPPTEARVLAFNAAADVLAPLTSGQGQPDYSLGAEAWVQGRMALRGGWSRERGFSTGATLGLPWFRLDYAMLFSRDFPVLNRVTTHFFFGGRRP